MNNMIKKWIFKILVPICIGYVFAFAWAQNYPTKPIKILVGFSPGGVPDIAARVISQKLSEKWGQAVVVENNWEREAILRLKPCRPPLQTDTRFYPFPLLTP